MKADLHIHSEFSYDSYESIDQIINKAKEKQVDFIAVCDHNAIEGSQDLIKRQNILSISGIEIDCFFGRSTIHVLGYGCDLTDKRFNEIEKNYKAELERCSDRIIKMMERKYEINMDRNKIVEYSNGKPVTHVAIIRYLLNSFDRDSLKPYQNGRRSFSPVANYYWDNLAVGKEFYVEKQIPDVKDTIRLIHESGGLAIIAHPSMNIGCDLNAAKKLLEIGADGFEVYCSYHDSSQISFYHDLCTQMKCFETAGSDYHGNIKPQVELGMTNYERDCDNMIQALLERIKR